MHLNKKNPRINRNSSFGISSFCRFPCHQGSHRGESKVGQFFLFFCRKIGFFSIALFFPIVQFSMCACGSQALKKKNQHPENLPSSSNERKSNWKKTFPIYTRSDIHVELWMAVVYSEWSHERIGMECVSPGNKCKTSKTGEKMMACTNKICWCYCCREWSSICNMCHSSMSFLCVVISVQTSIL